MLIVIAHFKKILSIKSNMIFMESHKLNIWHEHVKDVDFLSKHFKVAKTKMI